MRTHIALFPPIIKFKYFERYWWKEEENQEKLNIPKAKAQTSKRWIQIRRKNIQGIKENYLWSIEEKAEKLENASQTSNKVDVSRK